MQHVLKLRSYVRVYGLTTPRYILQPENNTMVIQHCYRMTYGCIIPGQLYGLALQVHSLTLGINGATYQQRQQL
jgi:hypothetical protein